MMRYLAPVALVVLGALGGVLGRVVAPAIAEQNDTVRLAQRMRLWGANDVADRQDPLYAWSEPREGQEKPEALYKRADALNRRIRFGSVVFGVWCGVVVALKLFGTLPARRENEYHIDHSLCVACARCFSSCPRERLRLKKLREDARPDSNAGESIPAGKE